MKNLFTLLFIIVAIIGNAQEKTVSGIVSDESNVPLPAATILVKGTTNGTSTNFDGEYTIKANLGDVLVFSYVGYESKEVIVSEKEEININMKPSTALEEIVVTSLAIKRSADFADRGTKVARESLSSIASKISVEDVAYELTKGSHDKKQQQLQSGLLTAGEINDLKKWDEWLSFQQNAQIQHINKTYEFGFTKPILVNILNEKCKPLANVQVKLFNENLELIMSSRTDISGKTYLFKDAFNAKQTEFYTIQVLNNGQVSGKKIKDSFNSNIDFTLEDKNRNNDVDIMFTIDATGSMGDEMNYLKAELANIFNRIDSSIETKRLALTF